MTSTSSCTSWPTKWASLSLTSWSLHRMKGLWFLSSAMVYMPVVEWVVLRSLMSLVMGCSDGGRIAALKATLDLVYSWPQYTSVWSGSDESLSIAESICCGWPSKNLPHPLMKSVSPVNTPDCAVVVSVTW